jgi:hypothetical protein
LALQPSGDVDRSAALDLTTDRTSPFNARIVTERIKIGWPVDVPWFVQRIPRSRGYSPLALRASSEPM